MNKMFKYIRVFFFVFVGIYCLPAQGYLCSLFDTKRLFNEADTVCKIKVEKLKNEGIYTVENRYPKIEAEKITVEAKVISEIKGDLQDTIKIIFPAPPNHQPYTDLDKGEVAIVFLKKLDKNYEFVDIHNGKMICSEMKVKYEYGNKPKDKILSELIALCKNRKGKSKLYAVERLGELEDIRAKDLLLKLSNSDDVVLKGQALSSLIQIRANIKEEKLLDFLKLSHALFDQGESLKKYDTTGYCIFNLHARIISNLESSIKNRLYDLENSRPSALIKDFDYISFYEEAYKLKVFADCPRHRSDLASALRKLADKESVPLVKRLLDDTSSDVRYYAVTTLVRIFKEGEFPSTGLFQKDEKKYISFWKKKLREKGL